MQRLLGVLNLRQHLRCLSWALLGAVLGLCADAYADATTPAGLDAILPGWAVGLVREGGLPGALLVLGWWARGLALKGIPVEVRLHPETVEHFKPEKRADPASVVP